MPFRWAIISCLPTFQLYASCINTLERFMHDYTNALPLPPSSETQGQSVGSGEKSKRKFSLRTKEPLGTDSHRTISKNSSGCRLLIGHKKCFVLLCPIGEHISMSSFRVFVNDGYCLDHGLSSLCTREMHAVRKLSVWYKIPIWSNSLTLSNASELFWTISKFMNRMNFVIACLLLRKTWS